MKVNAKFIAKHGTSSSHGSLEASVYWATIEEESIVAEGILVMGEYESEPFDDGLGELGSSLSPYIIFHPFHITAKYDPDSGFSGGVDFPDDVETALYRAWKANPAGDVEFA